MSTLAPFLIALLAPAAFAANAPQSIKYFVGGRQKETVDKDQKAAREKDLKAKRDLVMVPHNDYSAETPFWNVGVWEFIVGGGRWKGVADTAAELLTEVALGHLDFFRHKDPKDPKAAAK